MRAPGNVLGNNSHYDSVRWCPSVAHWQPQADFAYPGNNALGCSLWVIVSQRSHAAIGTVCVPRKQMTRSAVVREPPSVSVNITRPDWLNTHTPPALIMRNVSPSFFQRWNYAALFCEMREMSTVSLTETEESDVPDKRRGISEYMSLSAGRHQWMSLLLTSRCQRWQTQSAHHATRPQFGATLPPQRVHHDYGPSRFLTSL